MSIYLNLYSYRFVRKRIIKLITRREKTIKNFAKIKYKKDIEEFYRKLQVTFILYDFIKKEIVEWEIVESWRKANRIDPERNYSGNPLSSGRRFRLIVILEESETFIQINIVQLSNMFFKLFRILIL